MAAAKHWSSCWALAGCDWVGKVIWGMEFPFRFAVGAVRHSGRQDNSSPFTRNVDCLWGQQTQIQARAPLHQHHMSKTWSLLQCSACLFCLEVFFFWGGGVWETLWSVRHWISSRHLSLFPSIWHHNRDKPACSPTGEAQTQPIPILTCQVSHITCELHSSVPNSLCTAAIATTYNSSHFSSSIFHWIPWQEQGWSIAAGKSRLPRVKCDLLEQAGDVLEQVCLSILQL